MLIGLVTDIHDHVEPLARALDLFRRRGVDQVITLGDSCEAFTRHSWAAEDVELLRGAIAPIDSGFDATCVSRAGAGQS